MNVGPGRLALRCLRFINVTPERLRLADADRERSRCVLLDSQVVTHGSTNFSVKWPPLNRLVAPPGTVTCTGVSDGAVISRCRRCSARRQATSTNPRGVH